MIESTSIQRELTWLGECNESIDSWVARVTWWNERMAEGRCTFEDSCNARRGLRLACARYERAEDTLRFECSKGFV